MICSLPVETFHLIVDFALEGDIQVVGARRDRGIEFERRRFIFRIQFDIGRR